MYEVKDCWPETLPSLPFEFHADEHADLGEDQLVHRALSVLFDYVVPKKEEGDVLIFLPGKREIHKCADEINARAQAKNVAVAAFPLYAALPKQDQDRATIEDCRDLHTFEKQMHTSESGSTRRRKTRKVVCCTNIAETSLTINGVRFVIDSGKAKKMTYDHTVRLNVLKVEDISKASAEQRRGRGGRTNTGWFFPLYSKQYRDERMQAYEEPEMKQTPVEGLILHALQTCGESVESLGLLDPPDAVAVHSAKQRLLNLGFVSAASVVGQEHEGIATGVETATATRRGDREKLHLTKNGEFALSLPDFDLESSRMILAAEDLGCVEDALKLAALLAERDGDIFEKAEKNDDGNGKRGQQGNKSKVADEVACGSSDVGRSRGKVEPASIEERQLRFADDLGDHFTALNVFKEYENKKQTANVGEEALRRWCKSNGICYTVLKAVEKSVERAYDTLKRKKRLGSIAQKHTSSSSTASQHGNETIPKDDERVRLCKALVAGYFHNIAAPHNPRSIKAGFSLLTPMASPSVGRANRTSRICSSVLSDSQEEQRGEQRLLKLALSQSSSITTYGDMERNTFLVFGTLSKAKSGRCFMKMVSRVSEDLILQHTSPRWREQIGFARGKSPVVTKLLRHVGPAIAVSALFKDSSTTSSSGILDCGTASKTKKSGNTTLADIERETNACIDVAPDAGTVHCYGSRDETSRALELVRQSVEKTRDEFRANSHPVVFPKNTVSELQCQIGNGVQVVHGSYRGDLCAQLMAGWDHIEPGAIIFINVTSQSPDDIDRKAQRLRIRDPDHYYDSRTITSRTATTRNASSNTSDFNFDKSGQIRKLLESLASDPKLVHSVERHGGPAGSSTTYTAKILSVAEAKHIYSYLDGFKVLGSRYRSIFPPEAFAKLNEDVQIQARPPELYPSVLRIARAHYPELDVQMKGFGFRISKKDRKAKGAGDVAGFLRRLAEARVLESAFVDADLVCLLGADRVFASKMLHCWKTELMEGDSRVKISVYDRGSVVSVEVLGESDAREEALKFLNRRLRSFQRDSITKTIPLGVGVLSVVLKQMDEWRRDFASASFELERPNLGAGNTSSGTQTVPFLHIRGCNKAEVRRAFDKVQRLLADVSSSVLSAGHEDVCCICTQQILVRRGGKNNRRQDEAESETAMVSSRKGRQGGDHGKLVPEGFYMLPLTLCGCVYCRPCLEDAITEQLQTQCGRATRRHGEMQLPDVSCKICEQVLLMRDLDIILTNNAKNEVFRLASKNYLTQIAGEKSCVAVECPSCGTPALREMAAEQGQIYRCRNIRCYMVYCASCDRCIRNKLEYEAHKLVCRVRHRTMPRQFGPSDDPRFCR